MYNISAFDSKYAALVVDSEALMLQAMAVNKEIDITEKSIHAFIENFIEASLPSVCPELQAEFGKASLTAKNFVDLKCIILNWRKQHGDEKLTRGTKILKKSNWEGRKFVLFETILAIQKSEGFKKDQ